MLQQMVHRLGRVVARDGLAELADGELLRRFTTDGDPIAFEALVWRHGPMVIAACQRVLGRGGNADDAFQATFLTLVRHARSIRAGESLAGWLYRVARRVSVRVSRQKVRRAWRESQVARPEAVVVDEVERADWRASLDREIERLPPRYREAFILCHLEGRSHEAAARELGCPLGTLHSRLARAKERLRVRLGPCGLAVPAGVVSARLVNATVNVAVGFAEGSVGVAATAVVALSQGVWFPMVMLNMKCLIAAVLAVATIGSVAVLHKQPAATAAPAPTQPPEPTIEELKRENERLRREVADLKKRLAEIEARTGRVDDPPTDAEVLRALPAADGATRDNITIVKNNLSERFDPVRQFPLIGPARVRHQHWECTVYFTETAVANTPFPIVVKKPRVVVVYIDKDTLVRVTDVAK